jgi:hypothetical protein
MSAQNPTMTGWRSPQLARSALNTSATLWFIITMIGQLFFCLYIVAFYYSATFNLNIDQFNLVMPAGYIEGDFWGNIMVITHVLFAAIITLGGVVQLVPQIRNKWAAFHRWNGRIYVLTATIVSLSGAFMIITRFDLVAGDAFGKWILMLNGALILLCAGMAFKRARQRQFVAHRVWALRLFIVVSGVWLFRIGIMAWLTLHGKPVGFDPVSFSGPFLNVLYVCVYLLPLLLMEGYLQAHASHSARLRIMTASGILLLTGVLALGVFGAIMGMWLPRL